eukprot:Phypoly_transcript_03209.p1 GENE.Phypoly_transcript_03209~~Phypoly_transcript_03209.p1  ORF type:complete len:774 (+),score=97.01 Phypoly_transcript_03209:164-2485(+)
MYRLTLACWVLALIFGSSQARIKLREIQRKDLNFTKPAKLYSSEWAIHLNGNLSSDFTQMGFEMVGQVGNLPNMYQVRHRETHTRQLQEGEMKKRGSSNTPSLHEPSEVVTSLLLSHPSVTWAQQQELVQHHKRAVSFKDPLYNDQWHLNNVGQFDGVPGQDINVLDAWNAGYTGMGVQIAIVDDGYQYTHPDLMANYVAADSANFNGPPGEMDDPAPDTSSDTDPDHHGTAAAGVAMAASNDVCGVGAAYQAKGAGIRLISKPVGDVTDANAMTYHNQNNDIYSSSWGPTDDGNVVEGPGSLLAQAMAKSVNTGRGGKGSIYVWAAGNGGALNDNCNYDGFANSRFAIAVGAIGNKGVHAFYSEPCAALMVVAPSSSSNTAAGIRTIDLLGTPGYSNGDCYNQFTGTSSACPLVAGVIALVLQANPDLTWRDVAVVLASSARKNDPADSDWTKNAKGYHINHKYGFGAVDATAAVNLAKTHVLLAPETYATAQFTSVTPVPPNSATGFTANLRIGQSFIVERVVISVVIDHPTSGDLQVILTSPHGTKSVLAQPHSNTPVIGFPGSTAVHQIGTASFGPDIPFVTVQATVVATVPSDACTVLTNCASLDQNIAYVSVDGFCDYTDRARAVQGCGAIAMLVYNTDRFDGGSLKIIPGTDSAVKIPVGFVDYDFAQAQDLPGKEVQLGQTRYPGNSYAGGWNFSSVRLMGESSEGTWKLNVADPRPQGKGVSGTISNLKISVYGSNSPASFTSSASSTSSCFFFTMVVLFILAL